MGNLETKANESIAEGQTAKQLEEKGYKPLSTSHGYMFNNDAKPRLFRLNEEKQLYFPVNSSQI